MVNLLTYLACAVAALGAAGRWRLARGRHRTPGSRLLVAFALCIGASLAVVAPASTAALGSWRPLDHSLALIGDQLKLAAECLLALLAYAMQSGEARQPRVRIQLAVSALVMAASTAAYLAGGLSSTGSTLDAGPGGRIALGVYSALFTVHSCWCAGVFTLVVVDSARLLGPGPLRAGLRLVVAGGVLGLLWAVLSVEQVVDGFMLGHEASAEDVVSAPVAVLAVALGVGGATLTAWSEQLGRPARWLRAWRDYHRVGPLWAALRAARPEITLEPAGARRGLRALWGDPEFALYRRVIEIRDGHLALRPYFHPGAAGWAAAACGGADSQDVRRSATVEAAVLAAALLGAAAGREYGGEPDRAYAPHQVRADLEAEVAWLALVCAEFTCSAVVEQVRRRVRAELRAAQD